MAANTNFNTVALKQTACAGNANRIATKSSHSSQNCSDEMVEKGTKRKADMSLAKQEIGAKRFALGNLTNAETTAAAAEHVAKPTWKPNEQHFKKNKVPKINGVPRIMTRAAMRKQQAVNINQDILQDKPIAIIKDKENVPSSSEIFEANGAGVVAVSHANRKAHELLAKSKTLGTVVDNRASWKNVLRTRSTVVVVEAESTTQEPVNGEQQKTQTVSTALPKRSELKPKRGRPSSEFEASDNSLYVTAVENLEEATGQLELAGLETDCVEPRGQVAQTKKPQATNNGPPARPDVKLKRGRGSNEFEDNSLYVTAVDHLDVVGTSTMAKGKAERSVVATAGPASTVAATAASLAVHDKKTKARAAEEENGAWKMSITENVALTRAATTEIGVPRKQPPVGIEDYDLCYWNDIYQVSEYAQDIFDYLQEREPAYDIPDYMGRQKHLTKRMRALLVDWMIEIQETFELNHETLYLAVKILDTYLSRVTISHEVLQLVGIASMLIASKYDERLPPTVDDFVYFCDGAYDRADLLKMERTVFRTIEYDLGYPLSYRFLRRYARVNRIPMMTLTLARYILETGLIDYNTVVVRDSKLACAALFIARRMLDQPGWNETLEYYSCYKVDQFKDAIVLLNNGMSSRQYPLDTVRNKYSHELFFEVAKRPVITSVEKLFANTNVLFKVPTAPLIASNDKPATIPISAAKENVPISTTGTINNATCTLNK
ncbi:G2/mitotic-specific cyclin-B3 isoform X2 [Anopheles moucheti]|uniref:G2/mitotic-specific cyclin-B3 isoform X2 n=1 Tax=Anopheles moucheti TaxID=186751 RepID=UPI0022F0D522|nr:G2/mitotic-specific cyclin-B3 isoform X2 [Anopheles moucheti]